MPQLTAPPTINTRNDDTANWYVDDFSGDTDAEKIQAAYTAATGLQTTQTGRNATLRLANRTYEMADKTLSYLRRVGLQSPGHAVLNWATPTQGMTLIQAAGFGGTMRGITITCGSDGDTNAIFEDIIGLDCESVSSWVIEDVKIRLYGKNTKGITNTRAATNNESVVWDGVDVLAAMPFVQTNGGDNLTIKNYRFQCGVDPADGTSPGATGANVWACAQGNGVSVVLNHQSFRNGQTIGGHHAFYYVEDSAPNTGQCGLIENNIDSAGVDPGDTSLGRYHFDFNHNSPNHSQENLVIRGCNDSPGTVKSYFIRGVIATSVEGGNNKWNGTPVSGSQDIITLTSLNTDFAAAIA